MASTVIGKVLPTFTGQYDQEKKYTFLDVVLYKGSSYVCRIDNSGQVPDGSSDSWVLLAKAGDSTDTRISYDADKHVLKIDDKEVSLATEQKIDQDDSDKSKKPSEYSEGFSYELKKADALDLDRSNYDKSVQDGTQGILTTTVVAGFARQRLEIVDSTRPLTFERNGTKDTWNGWEFVTNLVAVKDTADDNPVKPDDGGKTDKPSDSGKTDNTGTKSDNQPRSDAPKSDTAATSDDSKPSSEVSA